MTVVVGGHWYEPNGSIDHIIMGADSRITCGDQIMATNENKLIEFPSGLVVGYSGTGPVSESLRLMVSKNWRLNSHSQVMDFHEAAYKTFQEISGDKDDEMSLLVKTANHKLLFMPSKGTVIPVTGLATLGNGGPYALGLIDYLLPLAKTLASAKEAFLKGLRKAAKFSPDCGEPYKVMVYTS